MSTSVAVIITVLIAAFGMAFVIARLVQLRTRLLAAPGALMEAERDMERGLLTARGLDRVLRVAWTLADLRGADRPEAFDIAVALELRTGISRGASVLDRAS